MINTYYITISPPVFNYKITHFIIAKNKKEARELFENKFNDLNMTCFGFKNYRVVEIGKIQ